MDLKIISSAYAKHHSVQWVEMSTSEGDQIIEEGHAPTVLFLKPDSEIVFSDGGNTPHKVLVKQALAHITRTNVTILVTKL